MGCFIDLTAGVGIIVLGGVLFRSAGYLDLDLGLYLDLDLDLDLDI